MRLMILALTLCLIAGPARGEDQTVAQLIEQLGNPRYKLRRQAQQALIKRGAAAWPQIARAHATTKDLERKQRLAQLLHEIRRTLADQVFALSHALPDSDGRSAAALAPDGTAAVYFTRNAKKGYDFYRFETASGKRTLLARLPDADDEPSASLLFYGGMTPGGAVAVVSRFEAAGGKDLTYAAGVLGADGTLRWHKQPGAMYYPFLLAADGKSATVGEITLENGRPKIPAPFGISRLSLETGSKTGLYRHADGGFPLHLTRSPDGKRLILLVATPRRKGSRIVVLEAATGKTLATSAAFDWNDLVFDDNLVLLSDRAGRKIYLTAQDEQTGRIKVFDVARGTLEALGETPLVLCGMLDDRYLSAYSIARKQACLVDAASGALLWQQRQVVLLGRAGKKAIFARLREGTGRVRSWSGLSVGAVRSKTLAQLIELSR